MSTGFPRGKHTACSVMGKCKPQSDLFLSRTEEPCEGVVWVGLSHSESYCLVITAATHVPKSCVFSMWPNDEQDVVGEAGGGCDP